MTVILIVSTFQRILNTNIFGVISKAVAVSFAFFALKKIQKARAKAKANKKQKLISEQIKTVHARFTREFSCYNFCTGSVTVSTPV